MTLGYAPDSSEDQAWLAAYDVAAKDRTEFLAEALEAATAPSAPAKKPGRPKKAKAGSPLDGDTPDDAKKAANQNGAPPKPISDEELTNAEKEAARQAEAAFH